MKIEILCSAMTGRIYAVKTDGRGNLREKVDVTQQAVNAVMQHMHMTKKDYESQAGELQFRPKASGSTE